MSVTCNICKQQIDPLTRYESNSQYFNRSKDYKYGNVFVQANVTISMSEKGKPNSRKKSLDLCDECALEQLEMMIAAERKRLKKNAEPIQTQGGLFEKK